MNKMNKKELEAVLEENITQIELRNFALLLLLIVVALLGYMIYDLYSIRNKVGKCFDNRRGNLVKIKEATDNGGGGFFYRGQVIGGGELLNNWDIIDYHLKEEVKCSEFNREVREIEFKKHIEESEKRIKKLERELILPPIEENSDE